VPVVVDLHEWIRHARVPQGLPGLHPRPTVEATSEDTVYELLDRALTAAASGIPEEIRRDLGPLDPFASTPDLWVLGLPFEVRLNDRRVHLIDSLADLPLPSDSATFVLKPRDDIKHKSDLLRRISKQLADSILLRQIPEGYLIALVDTILDFLMEDPFLPQLSKAFTLLDQLRGNANPSTPAKLHEFSRVLDHICRDDNPAENAVSIIEGLREPLQHYLAEPVTRLILGAIGSILQRQEIAAYNEFGVRLGRQFIENYWVPFTYPSSIWSEVQKGEGPTILSQIGSRLWRRLILSRRMERTKNILTRRGAVDNLGPFEWVEGEFDRFSGKALGLRPTHFVKEDGILSWWLEGEDIALRYYLIGVLSFPESFLAHLEGKDVANYKKQVTRLMHLKDNGEDGLKGFWDVEGNEVCVTKVLRREFVESIPGGVNVVFGQSDVDVKEFFSVHRQIQRVVSADQQARLVFVFNDLRNKLVHGIAFNRERDGLAFEHKGRRYFVDYESLLVTYHLLPSVLVRLYKAFSESDA